MNISSLLCSSAVILRPRCIVTNTSSECESATSYLCFGPVLPADKITLRMGQSACMLESFSDVVANKSDPSGRTSKVQHQVDTGDAQPERQPPRRLPEGCCKTNAISDMLGKGKIP